MRGSNCSHPARGIGKKKQTGSFSSNRIHSPGRVTFQFMVKV